ncbi:MAG: hypothetical protein E7547_05775 [Ruminococcaceae bacterium]|nr:hypothetical protein [Oscillospiraceae bacterium]
MAKYEAELKGNFYEILDSINEAIIGQSSSATLEDKSDFKTSNALCAVRVYERYSYSGGNRVSMNITLLECDGRIFVTVITSGGSQAMFFKINTLGESSFLDLVTSTLNRYRI